MMKRLLLVIMALLAVCATASAQGAANPPAAVNLGPFCAAFGMTIASSLCGLAQGKAIASAVESIARNPGAARAIQLAMLIGLAFVESLALYTLLVVFIFGH